MPSQRRGENRRGKGNILRTGRGQEQMNQLTQGDGHFQACRSSDLAIKKAVHIKHTALIAIKHITSPYSSPIPAAV